MGKTNGQQTGVVNIHGREYQTVALRVKNFREQHPGHAILTEILHCDDGVVRMKCAIADEDGRILATGHGEEYRKASEINKTSAVENCETSAIGRALAALGFGGTEFATANEIEKAKRTEAANIGQTARQECVDTFESFSPEEQAFLQKEAVKIAEMHRAGENAATYLYNAARFTNEEILGMWSLMPSDLRNKIKKQKLDNDASAPEIVKAFAPSLAEQG